MRRFASAELRAEGIELKDVAGEITNTPRNEKVKDKVEDKVEVED